MSLISEKVRQAVGLLGELDIDCWLTFTRESEVNGDPVLPYLAPGHVTWHSAFLVLRDGRTQAIVGRYDQQAICEVGAWDDVVGYVQGCKAPLQEFLKGANPKTIAVNYSQGSEICDGLTYGMYLTLRDVLGEIGMAERLVSAEALVSALRERKTDYELGRIREAIRHTQEIFGLVGGFIRPGRTEQEIAAFMQAEVSRRGLIGAWGAATCPAVFTGPDTAQAHYGPTGRPVESGHLLNMDFGVRVDSYCSDMQRTFYVMEPGQTEPPADVHKGFATILSAVAESFAALKPGALGRDVDAVARRIVSEAGFEEFPHGLGHQVGRFAHDGTALLGPAWEKYAGKPFRPLEPGMVFTLEPRLTVPGRGVVTIEEMAVVTEEGAEWLSDPQRELILIRP